MEGGYRHIVWQYKYVSIEDVSFIYCLMSISSTITISGVVANRDMLNICFEVVFPKIQRNFTYFSNLGETLMLKF